MNTRTKTPPELTANEINSPPKEISCTKHQTPPPGAGRESVHSMPRGFPRGGTLETEDNRFLLRIVCYRLNCG